MRNLKMKKFLAIGLSVFCVGTELLNLPASAALPPETETVSPMYIAITETDCDLFTTADGFECYGYTRVQVGYTAKVSVSLKKSTSTGWTTIKTWSDSNAISAEVYEEYTPTSSGNYRVEVTHSSYNSSGTLLESYVTYSSTVSYTKK